MDRRELIEQLATEMGAPLPQKTNMTNYNRATGTFYCSGHVAKKEQEENTDKK